MPPLPTLKPKEVISKLKRAGFIEDRQKGSHVIMRNPITKRRTTVPFHVRDLPKGTLGAIIEDSGLTRDEFIKI